jgi:prepilin-type N-terminal cleavage/methylation domain-containing protein
MNKQLKMNRKGFSLIEVTVTLLLLTVVMLIFYELMISSMKASMFVESHNDLVVIGQRAMNTIQTEIEQAKVVFQENTTGDGYRTLFETALTAAGSTVWADSRLPLFKKGADDGGSPPVFIPAEFEADDPGGTPPDHSGNSLLLIRQLQPLELDDFNNDQLLPAPTCTEPDPATPNVKFLADQYRLEYYYLSANNKRNFAGKGQYLDLMESYSQVFADYFQLSNLNACQLPQVTAKLVDAGITLAWDPGKDSGSAFWTIDAGGALAPIATPAIILTRMKTMLPELKGGRISGRMEYSVGYNSASITNPNFKFPDPIPFYAQVDNNFPGGLEFKGVDNAGVKKIFSRIVLLSQYGGLMESQANFVITSYKGL